MTTKVLVVDDHPILRAGIRRAVSRVEDLAIVGEAATKAEAYAQINHHQPNVLVVDINLPDGSGLEVIAWGRSRYQDMGIVALTVFNLPEHIIACMESGASAHVDKAAPVEELIEAIKRSAVAPHNFSARKITEAISAKNRVVGLTPREIEILEILPTGDTVTQIAARLFISVSTTKTHLASIYRKLGAVNRVQAINAARRAGLLHQ